MEPVQNLIDSAAEVCGSRYKLSKRIDVAQSHLSEMASGKRGIPPRVAAKLAAVAGLDPRDALVIATIEKEKDPEERAALTAIFFRAGVVAMLGICIAGSLLLPSPVLASQLDSYRTGMLPSPGCILCQLVKAAWQYFAGCLKQFMRRVCLRPGRLRSPRQSLRLPACGLCHVDRRTPA